MNLGELKIITFSLKSMTSLKTNKKKLTVHGHPHRDAFLKAAQLALVARDLVDDAATFIFTGVGRMEILLDGPTEKTLRRRKGEQVSSC